MCGIAGFISSSFTTYEHDLNQMGNALHHRGPDSCGSWFDADNGVGLAHRRLSIVDLSINGHQPMISPTDRYIIVFNGEIYNHLLIREEIQLVDPNVTWRGSSDTETALKSIEYFGVTDAVQRWVGMFAFGLWDKCTNKLILGRDRFGEKPLYYGNNSGRFWFASELKAMTASEHFNPSINRDALALYFRHHYIPSPYSIYKNIFKLEPGTLVEISDNGKTREFQQYWSASDVAYSNNSAQFDGDIQAASKHIENLLIESVVQQCVADVPVGAFLSGGIDSSLVVSLMQKHTDAKVKTFCVGFEDPRYNEANHALKVATHLETEHTEVYFDTKQLSEIIGQLIDFYDEPFADTSQLPTYLVSKVAREDVTVSLSGDGGDELFGGYTRYGRINNISRWRNRFGKFGQGISQKILSSPFVDFSVTGRPTLMSNSNNRFFETGNALGKGLHLISKGTDAEVYQEIISYWTDPARIVLGVSESHCDSADNAVWKSSSSIGEAVQMTDILSYLPDNILTKVDRAAMGCSLETRIPMLDHRLVEFIWSLPKEFRTSNVISKKILFDILIKHVPREIVDRPKTGFGIPIDDWLRGDLRDWAASLLDEKQIETDGYLNAKLVSKTWNLFLKGNSSVQGSHIWGILTFQMWLNHHMKKIHKQ